MNLKLFWTGGVPDGTLSSARTVSSYKENIGLIEVMGLAVFPARLKKEMSDLEEAILRGEYSFYRAKGNRNCLYKGFRGCRHL